MLGACNTCVRLQSRVTNSGITVSRYFFCLFVFVCFVFCFFGIVVFSYLVCLFVLFYFLNILFYSIYFTFAVVVVVVAGFFGLFVSWFPFMSLMCFIVSLLIFSNCC